MYESKQLLVMGEESRKIKHSLLDQILDNCYVDNLTGQFHCKKCGLMIHIDWSQNLAFCPEHGVL